ncbi:DUF2381 family protein [Hyalangium sp.]|uniref:DUF2381 family protein n=1 Tax=Hyalangium sp. TaxID=2028555 RepID=UPI002D57717A|nr:DUF2381 family protein [Hyalangium sp.]HYI00659.1 DUF2381 family protein [Hyalangium sp.]
MSSPFLLALVLLVGADAAAPFEADSCARGVQRIELKPEPMGQAPEVCLSPGLATVFSFDAEIEPASVTLEGAERFAKVELGGSTLKLVPSEKLLPGVRLRLVLRFKDGAAPVIASFWLVAAPDRAGGLVEVYRHKRTVESLQQEVAEQDAKLHQCREENARLRAPEPVAEGLVALLEEGLMDKRGVVPLQLTGELAFAPGIVRRLRRVYSYRSRQRVAVELIMEVNQDAQQWTATGAELVGPERRSLRVLHLRQSEFMSEGSQGQRILIEAEATREQAQESFTLRLWDAGGTRDVLIHGVTFP